LKHLKALERYFWKYRYRLFLGIVFIVVSNYFAVLAPQVTGYVFDVVSRAFGVEAKKAPVKYDWLVTWFIDFAEQHKAISVIALCGITILVLALIRGIIMFLMRTAWPKM
jgi:ATP-binding cassette subfamily B multidrug efflux pump